VARFLKALQTFRAHKAIFSPSLSKNGEVYMPKTSSSVKGTSLHIKNMWIKQLCSRKVQDFAMALETRKVSGAFEKPVPCQSQVTLLKGENGKMKYYENLLCLLSFRSFSQHTQFWKLGNILGYSPVSAGEYSVTWRV